jgi:hypothetical protein
MENPLITDIHIHAPPFNDPANGVIVRPTPMKALFLSYIRYRLGIPASDTRPNETYIKNLSKEIKDSRYIENGVVFGLDGVYGSTGELDRGRTRFMVTNDFVFRAIEGFNKLLPGASVNPMRRDAIEELERCKGLGARLIKVLPPTQGFDPADKRFIPFYRKLEELKLPLLTHSGYEFALPVTDHCLGDPARMRCALDEGTTVILAHAGSSGIFIERHLQTVRGLVRDFPNLFLDTSALTLPQRAGMVRKLLHNPELGERLLFGTDYPVPAFIFPFILSLPWPEFSRLMGEKNRFDRQYLLFTYLGIRFKPPPLARPGALEGSPEGSY